MAAGRARRRIGGDVNAGCGTYHRSTIIGFIFLDAPRVLTHTHKFERLGPKQKLDFIFRFSHEHFKASLTLIFVPYVDRSHEHTRSICICLYGNQLVNVCVCAIGSQTVEGARMNTRKHQTH